MSKVQNVEGHTVAVGDQGVDQKASFAARFIVGLLLTRQYPVDFASCPIDVIYQKASMTHCVVHLLLRYDLLLDNVLRAIKFELLTKFCFLPSCTVTLKDVQFTAPSNTLGASREQQTS
jgi:hypothetical protein